MDSPYLFLMVQFLWPLACNNREAYRRRFVNTAWLSAPIGVTFAAVVWSVYPWLIQSEAFLGVEENRQVSVRT